MKARAAAIRTPFKWWISSPDDGGADDAHDGRQSGRGCRAQGHPSAPAGGARTGPASISAPSHLLATERRLNCRTPYLARFPGRSSTLVLGLARFFSGGLAGRGDQDPARGVSPYNFTENGNITGFSTEVVQANRNLLSHAQIRGANSWQLTHSVVIPSAMSWIFASLHASFGFAIVIIMVVALAAEYAMTLLENRLVKWRPAPLQEIH